MIIGNWRKLMFITRSSFITGVLVTLALTILTYDVNAAQNLKISHQFPGGYPHRRGLPVIASAASLLRRLPSGATVH